LLEEKALEFHFEVNLSYYNKSIISIRELHLRKMTILIKLEREQLLRELSFFLSTTNEPGESRMRGSKEYKYNRETGKIRALIKF